MKILLIDDIRSPKDIEDVDFNNGKPYADNGHYIDIAKTAENGANLILTNDVYDLILLDHDLGEGKSGTYIIDIIEQNPTKAPKLVRLITANIIAGPLMLNRLKKLANEKIIDSCSWIKPFKGN